MRALLPLAPLALALAVVGCSSSADSPGAALGSGGAEAGGSGGSADTPSTLEFLAPGPLAAREPVAVTVRARPPGVYRVQFALPTSNGDPLDGDPLDAVLDRAEADTDAEGFATVEVTAPSSPAKFELRASVGAVVAVQALAVEDGGVATVQVEPRRLNLSALRDINTWIASAYTDKSCAELPGIPPEDGPIMAPAASKTDAPVIPRVPARTRLAITLRSGHFIGGCTTVESLPPGPVTSPQVVVVSLLNRPIDLSASYLTLAFSLESAGAAWQALLTEAGQSAQTALLGASTDDVDALLDAMREASGDSRQLFENTRKGELWDDLLRARWGSSAGTALQDTLAAWLMSGRARFASTGPTFRGMLSPLPQSAPAEASTARLELATVAAVSATSAGFAESARVAWSASPDDTVALGTELYFVRSRLATALAEAAALEDFPETTDAAEALSEALDCSALAEELTQAGTDGAVAFGTCAADCLVELCQRGLGTLWNRAADAEGLTPTRLSLTATAKAFVGDGAEVAGLTGTWIGELGSDGAKLATGGALTAATPPVAK
jgi:hypothetical protein